MGWSSGSELAEDIWNTISNHISKDNQEKVARKLIELFENYDCDTIDEAYKLCKAANRKWHDED